jgi:hypothetical protein
MPQPREGVRFGAIWGARFTAPKVLGSMVRNENAKPWIALKS